MIEHILNFLTSNRAIIVGAAITIAEVIVVVINVWRKNRAEKTLVKLMNIASKTYVYDTKVQTLLWILNPINLFRKP